MTRFFTSLLLAIVCMAGVPTAATASSQPPPLAREFRAMWIATAYNIDWPSKPGLSASAQQAELRRLLDTAVALRMNAVVFQVRPMSDAVYASSIEPWSHFLTGTMGKSPGYDPLAYCLREAHARGLEVHAWFNPFRALCNNSQPTSGNHITRTRPQITKRFSGQTWCDPGISESRSHALRVILDVVRRYDIDGVHLDDYFYPYPKEGVSFPDGRSPAQRRAAINDFVSSLYHSVKKAKPWVRVGISPFGIWRPGVPEGIEAGLDSYEDLAGDSRKWLQNAWVDYLAPQLYWRINPKKQSFPMLISWWRDQGKRPVWPGIATQRIGGSEDGRPASEIINQIHISRKVGRNWHGHIHWSAKSLLTDQGGIRGRLAAVYTEPALVPPMPWIKSSSPASPKISASQSRENTQIQWSPDDEARRIVVQARYGSQWRTLRIAPDSRGGLTIPRANAIALTAVDAYGNLSAPKVLALP